MLEWLLISLFGLCIGSFAATLSIRIPQNRSIFTPLSSCDSCKRALKPYHIIPLVSFICLKGKCAFCKEKIPLVHVLLEIITLFLALILTYCFGASSKTLYLLSIFALMLTASAIDIQHQKVSSLLLFATLALSYIYLYSIDTHFIFALLDSLGIVGLVALVGILMHAIMGKKNIGEGDIVIIAISSVILGSEYNYIALLVSSTMALAAMLSGNHTKIAFIPYLTIGTIMVLVWSRI